VALQVVIAPQAAEQIKGAARWWSKNRPLAPGAIKQDLKAALELLVLRPRIGASCEDSPIPDLRRLLLGRVQYFIYYQPQQDALRVLAFWHSSRAVGPVIKT
jgi:plasmid stabilization system protein ParE